MSDAVIMGESQIEDFRTSVALYEDSKVREHTYTEYEERILEKCFLIRYGGRLCSKKSIQNTPHGVVFTFTYAFLRSSSSLHPAISFPMQPACTYVC